MVTKAELVAVSKKEKIPLGTVEKDYVLTAVLKQIYHSDFKDRLVFKGGTALHKLYLAKRFSVDMDFTELEKMDTAAFTKILEHSEIQSRVKNIDAIGNSIRITLGYISVLEFANRIFLDISRREKPVLPLVKKNVHTPFFESFEALTFQLEELLAEKLRALMQRKKPRDYLDLYYILESGTVDLQMAVEIAQIKLAAYKEEFDIKKLKENIDLVQSLWKADLREILPAVPDFGFILDRITDIFSAEGF